MNHSRRVTKPALKPHEKEARRLALCLGSLTVSVESQQTLVIRLSVALMLLPEKKLEDKGFYSFLMNSIFSHLLLWSISLDIRERFFAITLPSLIT